MTDTAIWLSPNPTLTGSRLFEKWRSFAISPGTNYLPSESAVMPRLTTAEGESDIWLMSARQRLNELSTMTPGWDGGTALAVDPDLLSTAWTFITSELVSRLSVKPDIVPTFRGDLLLEWHSESVDLIIEVSSTSEASFYLCDNEVELEVEGPISENLDSVATAFAKLGLHR
jgi:hypothetical protein